MNIQSQEHTAVVMDTLPKCDFCPVLAKYDGKTAKGPWAYMCPTHFATYGVGLGLGNGQQLMLKRPATQGKKKTSMKAQKGQQTTADKLQQLAGLAGMSIEELLQEATGDSVVAGICTNADCDYTAKVEPDQDRGFCEVCGTNTIESALVLAGLI